MNSIDFPIFIHERILKNSYSNIEYSFTKRTDSNIQIFEYSLATLMTATFLSLRCGNCEYLVCKKVWGIRGRKVVTTVEPPGPRIKSPPFPDIAIVAEFPQIGASFLLLRALKIEDFIGCSFWMFLGGCENHSFPFL